MLDASETEWLNTYHQKVFEALSPQLSADEKAWLENKCAQI
jgi:Xaa-Pro aminopeptidase